jgi:hypothetical protein
MQLGLFASSFDPFHPAIVCSANRQMKDGGWDVLYRMFIFVDCGKAIVYDVDENGKWGEE